MERLVFGLIVRAEDADKLEETLEKYKAYPFGALQCVADMSCVSKIMSHLVKSDDETHPFKYRLAGKPIRLNAFDGGFTDEDAYNAIHQECAAIADKYLVLKCGEYPVLPPNIILSVAKYDITTFNWYVNKQPIGFETSFDSSRPRTPRVAVIKKELMPNDWRNSLRFNSLVAAVNVLA